MRRRWRTAEDQRGDATSAKRKDGWGGCEGEEFASSFESGVGARKRPCGRRSRTEAENITVTERYNTANEHMGTTAEGAAEVQDLGVPAIGRRGVSCITPLLSERGRRAWGALRRDWRAEERRGGGGGNRAEVWDAGTVFHGTKEEALGLRDSVLELAAEEGGAPKRDGRGDEVLPAGNLSRGSDRGDDSALKASNIAQIDTATSANYLSAIMVGMAFTRRIWGVLNQLNAMAISWNVTNAEMLDGISR